MVWDYRDVFLNLRRHKMRRRRRILSLFLLICFLATVATVSKFFWERRQLVVGQELLLVGSGEQNRFRLTKGGWYWFFPQEKAELVALAKLLREPQLNGVRPFSSLGKPHLAKLIWRERFLQYLTNRGEYVRLRQYTDYLRPVGEDVVRFYTALAHTAFLRPRASESWLKQLSPVFIQSKWKEIRLLGRMNGQLQSGPVAYVLDNSGVPLACFDSQRRVSIALVPGFSYAPFRRELLTGLKTFKLTLNGRVQQAVQRMFAGLHGSLLLLEIPDNRIICAYSHSAQATAENAVFAEQYEPGSIVKVITLLAYLHQPVQDQFPFLCKGNVAIGQRLFYDWIAHGRVRNCVEALALSCNVAFAAMVRRVGGERLRHMLGDFLFNAPPLEDIGQRFFLGRMNPVGEDAYRLAELAVGLREMTITTFHAALLASLVAQNGSYSPPYLVEGIDNVLSLGIYTRHNARERLLVGNGDFAQLKTAMVAVATHERGTGRRAVVDFCSLAVKTGTAGNKEGELDAVVIAFFPVEKPRYALAFRLTGGGRAELRGALFLHDFLIKVYREIL